MIPDQRREAIRRELQHRRVLSVQELAKQFDVSHMTIRRDLAALEREGEAELVPGGIKLHRTMRTEPSRLEKASQNLQEKVAIAKEARGMIEDGMTLYLDAGTTTQALAYELSSFTDLTIATNDFAIVQTLVQVHNNVIHIGGFVEARNQSTVGDLATLILNHLNFDIAFMSASSWSANKGLTTPTRSKVCVKQTAIARAENRILLADSSKFSTFGAYWVADLKEFTCIITDSFMSASDLDRVRETEVDLRVAEASSSHN